MLARLIIIASFMRKTFVLLVCIRMYPYVSRMYPYVTRMSVVCIRMYPYVPYVTRMLLVCYPYVLVWCFSHDPQTEPGTCLLT